MVQEKREKLRQVREKVSKCDMLLMNHLRTCMAGGTNQLDKGMFTFFDAAQNARDEVGPLEADYEPLEVALGAEESKLQEDYANVERKFEHFFRLNANPSSQQSMPSQIVYDDPSPESSVSGDEDGPLNDSRDLGLFHGTRIGEKVVIGQEPKYTEINAVSESAVAVAVGQRHQATHSPNAQDPSRTIMSSTVDHKGADVLSEVLIAVAGAEEYVCGPEARTRGDSRVLSSLTSHSLFETIGDTGGFSNDFEEVESIRGIDSLLLLDETIEHRLTLSDYLMNFESTRDRVNRWLLHRLRVSPCEVYALRRSVLACSNGVPDWTFLALREWANDELGSGSFYQHGSVEHDSVGAAHD